MKYLLAALVTLSSACASAGAVNGASSSTRCVSEFRYFGSSQGTSQTLTPGQTVYATHFTFQKGYYMSFTQEEVKFVGRTGDRTYAFEVTKREQLTGGGPATENTTPLTVYFEDETRAVRIGVVAALLHPNSNEPRVDIQFSPSDQRREC